MAGMLVSPKSYLARVENKLGEVSPSVDTVKIFEDPLTDRDLALELLRGKKEDIISRIFGKYPLNCENLPSSDASELDGMIARFTEGGSESLELLEKIIALVRSPREKNGDVSPMIERITETVKAHFTEEISVSEIASTVNISVYYLAHAFKNATGTTLTEYRNALRLTEAKRLLISTDMSVGEIAASCGFSGAAYFTEVFTRSELVPPTEYRRCHGN